MAVNKIRELRKAQGISQASLAKVLGVAQNTLSYWENGHYDIDNKSLSVMADYFHVSVDYILGREDQPQKNSPAPPEESEADLARKKLDEKLDKMDLDQLEKLLAFIDLLG